MAWGAGQPCEPTKSHCGPVWCTSPMASSTQPTGQQPPTDAFECVWVACINPNIYNILLISKICVNNAFGRGGVVSGEWVVGCGVCTPASCRCHIKFMTRAAHTIKRHSCGWRNCDKCQQWTVSTFWAFRWLVVGKQKTHCRHNEQH